ncbi:hypothetical protein A6A40_24030 (plasmid) [Azospirillum humicireducens]|uniref:Glycosyltransferase RgtA/B/C/D-like domain-containing protein n=1 Tax=Azospirillum humicireducens TaxID=1226968 RepID=A0A2R4VUJ4_9PROT|nr:hypothetical protein A6A40_24030 [Azospirillum humicireducens]
MIGGLLPWSDSHGHAFSGLHLLQEGALDVFGTRRSLSSAFSATRLLLGGLSLQGALLVQALLFGIAVFLAARAVLRTHGWLAAAILSALCLFAAQETLPTSLSETSGVIFGAVALAILWQALGAGSVRLYALGVLVLAVGLNIRPGDLAILPLCVVAAAYFFPGRGTRWQAVGLAALAVLAASGAAMAWGLAFGNPAGAPQANFAYTLYGLSVGQDWGAGFRDHPDLLQRLAVEQERVVSGFLFDRAVANILADPRPLIGQCLANLGHYLVSTPLIGYHGGMGGTSFLTAALSVAVLLSIRRSAFDTLVALAIVSTFLSAGLVYGDGGWKSASTLFPFWAAAIALTASGIVTGLRGWLARRSGRSFPIPSAPISLDGRSAGGVAAAPLFGCVLVLFAVFVPAVAAVTGLARQPVPGKAGMAAVPDCPEGQDGIVLRPGFPTATLRLHPSGPSSPHLVPDIGIDDFRRGLEHSQSEVVPYLKDVPAGFSVSYVYDLRQDRPELSRWALRAVYLVAPTGLVPASGGLIAVCGTPVSVSLFGPRLLRATSARPLP